jgi:hypothetical protein
MLTTSEVKVEESQAHYIDQEIGAPLISIDGTTREMDKLCIDVLHKHWKWKIYVMKRISMPRPAHKMLKEELEKCRNQIRKFKRKYMVKIGA